MAVTVEDGSQVTDSDSYVTRAAYIAYALTKGITIADSSDADEQLVKAAIYIGTHEGNLKGSKVDRDQSMAYPRNYLVIDGFEWLSTEIPAVVKDCQMEYALDLNSSVDLYNPTQLGSDVAKRESISGAVEVEYAIGDLPTVTKHSTARALLSRLLNSSGLSIP